MDFPSTDFPPWFCYFPEWIFHPGFQNFNQKEYQKVYILYPIVIFHF
nr:MAG TPA: hypothetical protein [Caudoviricetes sp.]